MRTFRKYWPSSEKSKKYILVNMRCLNLVSPSLSQERKKNKAAIKEHWLCSCRNYGVKTCLKSKIKQNYTENKSVQIFVRYRLSNLESNLSMLYYFAELWKLMTKFQLLFQTWKSSNPICGYYVKQNELTLQ